MLLLLNWSRLFSYCSDQVYGVWWLAYALQVQEVSLLKMRSEMPSYFISYGLKVSPKICFTWFFLVFQQGVSGLPGAKGIPGEPGQLVRTFLERSEKTYIQTERACALLRSNLPQER